MKLDLHVHTAEVSECAHLYAGDVVQHYHQLGYQGLVITDHYWGSFFTDRARIMSWTEQIDNFLLGYQAARNEGEKLAMTVLLGVELRVNADNNDYLLYGISRQFLINHPSLHQRSLMEIKHLVGQYGGLVVQAHPYRYGNDMTLPEHIHGVEVFNGNIVDQKQNQLARQYAHQHNLIMTSGSDFHGVENYGRGGIQTGYEIGNEQEMVAMLKKGHYELITESVDIKYL